MTAVSPGWVSWMHSNVTVQTDGRAFLQIDDGLAALRQDIEDGAADADGRQRRRDLVGGLFRMAGDETKSARGQPYRDVAIMVFVVEHGAVELERGVRAERQIGAVGHHQPRRAVEAGAHDFIAQQSIADIDLAGGGPRDADHFILDDGGFADARLRLNGTCRQMRLPDQANKSREGSDASSFHSRSIIPTSYRIARACDVADLSQAAPYYPVG